MPDTGQTNECRRGQRARLALGNKPLTPEEHAMKQQLESEAALYKLYRTRVRICAETYGFARQKTRGGSMNLILISWMSFLVDF